MGLIFWRFQWRWCFDMENVNIASGGHGMQQEENQLPMSGYLGLFETYMSGYLGLFETCVIEFVQIWVSLLLFWVYEFYLLEVLLLIERCENLGLSCDFEYLGLCSCFKFLNFILLLQCIFNNILIPPLVTLVIFVC